MVHNEIQGVAATVAVGSAAVLDFGLLDQLPKGAVVSMLGLSLVGLWFFVRRDYKRFLNTVDENAKLKKRLVVVETKLGMHDKAEVERSEVE